MLSRLLSCALIIFRALGYSRTPSATLARSALGDESWWSFKTLAPLLFVVWPLTLTHKLLKTLIDFFWTLVPALSWPKTVENQVYLDSFTNRPYDFDPLGGGHDKFISMLFLG